MKFLFFMARKTSKKLITGLFLLTFILQGWGQSSQKQKLQLVLQSLEKKYAVVFTYADETLEGVNLSSAPKLSGLNQSLELLHRETGLIFEPINERYIAISKPREILPEKRCGYLMSSETSEPVIGASIQSGNSFTYSDERGYFEIGVSENASLSIQSLGFQTLEISAAEFSTSCKTLVMSVNRTTLDEITITDLITNGIDRMSDGSVTVRNQLIGLLPGLPQPDAIQTLQYLPGVVSVFESASELNIRGGTNDQNLYLLDGIKVYQTGHFFGLISGFNPHITEKVNLIKNGTTAYYGDGTSGTISMITDDHLNSKFYGSAGINLLYADGFLQLPLSKKISLHLSGRHSLPGAWQTPTYRKYYDRAFANTELTETSPSGSTYNEDFSFYDASIKLLYDISTKDKLRASFFSISNSLNYDEQDDLSGQQLLKSSSLDQQSLGSGINYTRLWSKRVKTTAEGYYSKYKLDAVNQNIAEGQQLIQGNEVLETGARLSSLIAINEQFYLQSGYQFFETGITNADQVDNPVFERRVKEVMRTHALFAEGSISLNEERTNIRVGLRTNYYNKLNKVIIEPRFVLSQTVNNTVTLELSGEQKSQSSIQVIDAQNDFLGIEKSRWLMVNGDDVPLLTSQQIAAGMILKKSGWLFNAEGYYKVVDGIITSSQGFQNQFQYIRSAGSYSTTGLDVLINHKSSQSLQWLRYSLAKSDYDFPELIPSSFPNNTDIRHIVNGGFSYRLSQFEFSTGANWFTGRPVTRPVPGSEIVAGEINYDSPNGERLKDYLRIDFSARWHFYNRENLRSHIGLSLWNITNEQNILDEFYVVNDANQAEKIEQPGLAFTPNLFLRIDF